MADVDIDPFGGDDRTESRTDETGENIPLSPWSRALQGLWLPQEEDQLGNQNANKKRHSGESLKELNSLVKPQKNFTMIISNLKMGNCATEVRESP